MVANPDFLGKPPEFWSNIKLLSQKIGYTDRKTSAIKAPSLEEMVTAYQTLSLNLRNLIIDDAPTALCNDLLRYFANRAHALNHIVEPNLMDRSAAEVLFEQLKATHSPTCPIPMNKQKGDKKAPSYFTGIVNILIEAHTKGQPCNFDPKSFVVFSHNGNPLGSISRRVDGAFPDVINPLALWEVKEYYNTTTFGSRVADGIYETLLDGYELSEIRRTTQFKPKHYLMVDDYRTWWGMGKSYLCRIYDMMHMGFLTEALFGREVVYRLPLITAEWLKELPH